ncbi:DUF2459 domain-containing protein [Oceanisphaera sp. KMM 10153]|uniref:DUF2459 domain-containing protein n=1 Tax=Oceanisphaera submarina TaxID=3390193 RepID=UPI0039749249
MYLRLVLLLSLLCAGCGVAGEWRPAVNKAHTLYLVDHGLHVGLVVPAAELERRLPELGVIFPGARFYEMGWGDRAFYQSEQAGAGLALRALLWPTEAVLHLVPLSGPPGTYFSALPMLELSVSPAGMTLLLNEVAASFVRDGEGKPQGVGTGRYGGGRFFGSVERYHLFHTCNTWVARRLAAAGLPLRPALAFTAGGLMRQAACCAKGEYAQGYPPAIN